MRKRFRQISALSAALVASLLAGISFAAPPIATYEVTIANLTSGQPLTPPVVATHRRPLHIFTVGTAASFEIKEIAENGNVTPLADLLAANKHVFESKVVPSPSGPPPILHNGGVLSFEISASPSAKYISFASMLICTNDGFTGIDGLRLPKKIGDTITVQTAGYDAGTEVNTEDFADIVPPCQGLVGITSADAGTGVSNPALAENGIISHHTGVVGGNDLVSGVHGWTDPVADVVITRID